MPATILASWGYAAAKALGDGGLQWRIRKIYIEFENMLDPEDPASIPSVNALNSAHGLPYYIALSGSSVRDFLRVDLQAAPLLRVASGYEGYFESGQGNTLQLFAQTAGLVGFHGREFSDSANSKICGIAAVVAPVEADQTQDIVVARAYYDEVDQVLKPSGSLQVGVTLELPFVLPE